MPKPRKTHAPVQCAPGMRKPRAFVYTSDVPMPYSDVPHYPIPSDPYKYWTKRGSYLNYVGNDCHHPLRFMAYGIQRR